MHKEDNELIESFMEHTFDQNIENFDNLEFYLGPKCNQSCKYCYLNRYGDDLYPDDTKGNYVENAKKAMKYLPDTYNNLEIFSGEPFIRDDVFKILEHVLDSDDMNFDFITIPTNGTFILNDEQTNRVENILKESREKGTPIYPSFSVDGKYCQDNRPMIDGSNPWTNEDWDKLFRFAKEWNGGFHPMVYSELMDKWKDNWLWFQNKFREHDIPFSNIYLLEVRNVEWDENSMKELHDFVQFLIDWTYNFLGESDEKMVRFVIEEGFNILSNPLSRVGRGIGCSIQSTFDLRLGDLAWVPCHRLSYDQFVLGHLTDEGIDVKNPELAIRTFTFDSNNFPMCEKCPIRHLCAKGCLGSQYETTGDMFTPIPTVCKAEYYKISGMIKKYREIGVLDNIVNTINENAAREIMMLEEEELV